MKKQLPGFIVGFLCAVMLLGIVVSSGALITGSANIQVFPINIMVNGEVFQPKDANGQPVDVFAYNGTTYVPLRAIAETFGLEVGYDKDKNLGTVIDPANPPKTAPNDTKQETSYSDWSVEEEAAYQEFVSMWAPSTNEYSQGRRVIKFNAANKNLFDTFKNMDVEQSYKFILRRTTECAASYPDETYINILWQEAPNTGLSIGSSYQDGKISILMDNIWRDVKFNNPYPLN